MNNLKMTFIVAPITTAILFYGAAVESFEPQYSLIKYPSLTEIYQQDVSSVLKTSTLGIETIKKLRTIQAFASKIVENIVDLEPAIIKMIDEDFWELI